MQARFPDAEPAKAFTHMGYLDLDEQGAPSDHALLRPLGNQDRATALTAMAWLSGLRLRDSLR